MYKKLLLLAVVISMVFSFSFAFGLSVKAAEENESKKQETNLTKDDFDMSRPVPSTTEMEKWGERKGNELVKLAQKWAIPVLQFLFVLGAIMTVIGAFSKSKMLGRGFLTMAISLVIYCFIKYAPIIFDAFQAWVKN